MRQSATGNRTGTVDAPIIGCPPVRLDSCKPEITFCEPWYTLRCRTSPGSRPIALSSTPFENLVRVSTNLQIMNRLLVPSDRCGTLVRSSRRPRFLTDLLPAAALALCTAVPAPLSAQEVIDLPARDRTLSADFQEVFRVGAMDGESWEMLGTVRHAGFDADGNLYLVDGAGTLDADGLRVLVFDKTGAFVREFGSAGEGPGEFNMPSGFAVMRNGVTVIGDLGHRAFQLFGPDGSFLRMVRADASGAAVEAAAGLILGQLLPDPRGGAVFSLAREGGFSLGIASQDGGDAPEARGADVKPEAPIRPILRVGLEAETVKADTVVRAWLPPRETALSDMISLSGGGARFMGPDGVDIGEVLSGISTPSVFEPPLLAAVLPDGSVVHADSSAYELEFTSPGASAASRILRRPIRPEAVTATIEKEYREALEEASVSTTSRMMVVGGGAPGGGEAIPGMSFSIGAPDPQFYHEIPVLRELAATWEGGLWVRRRGKEPESDGPTDVIDAAGRYVGTLRQEDAEVPAAFGPDGLAAFIELDDFDVATVVVRRLPATLR